MIGFTALAQGLLSDRYLDGVPADSRAAPGPRIRRAPELSDEMLAALHGLNEIASPAWPDPRPAGPHLGAARPAGDLARHRRLLQWASLEQNVAALENLSLSTEELARIEEHLTIDGSIDLWRQAREGTV